MTEEAQQELEQVPDQESPVKSEDLKVNRPPNAGGRYIYDPVSETYTEA